MVKQEILPLQYTHTYNKEDFIVGQENEAAYRIITDLSIWAAPGYIIVGPDGSGKTHLAHIFASLHKTVFLELNTEMPQVRSVLQSGRGAIIDDLSAQLSSETAEEALFHILNILFEQKVPFVLFSDVDIKELPLKKADTKSRLNLLPVIEVSAPDDDMLRHIYYKLFADNQVKVASSVIDYLVLHMPRSYAFANKAVPELVQEAFRQQRKLSIPLVKEMFNSSV